MGSCRWFCNQVAGNRLNTQGSVRRRGADPPWDTGRIAGVGVGKLVSFALMAAQENPAAHRS
jgi:hypothetical protein